MDAAEAPVFHHERQRGDLCLKHTLNNLHQAQLFRKKDLDAITRGLSPARIFGLWSPHCAFAFTGDYDANVMMAALASVGKDVRWHDARDAAYESLDPRACWGLILNSEAGGAWALFSRGLRSGRHYSGLRRLHGVWWHMDSTLPFVEQVTFAADAGAEAQELRTWLRGQRAADPSLHLFVITEAAKAPAKG